MQRNRRISRIKVLPGLADRRTERKHNAVMANKAQSPNQNANRLGEKNRLWIEKFNGSVSGSSVFVVISSGLKAEKCFGDEKEQHRDDQASPYFIDQRLGCAGFREEAELRALQK